jgi:16S rRNA (adenine1518-N6/adenine1519-N6)-dimethyltransferase
MKDGARRPKKRYGQHFLEPAWADRLVGAIAPAKSDRFVEIGPGRGALTFRLAPRVAHVTAVEIDPDMVEALERQVPGNVDVVRQDFLDFDLGPSGGAGAFRIAGNLPYNAASHIVLKLLDARRRGVPVSDATVMIQREVADRIAAHPGTKDYGTLSIFVQLRAEVTRLLTLPPGAFRPAPKVHSAVIGLTFHDPAVEMRDEPTFEALVRSIFTQRRKTLTNALGRFAAARGTTARDAIARAALDGTRRPETLQLTELARLADAFPSPS